MSLQGVRYWCLAAALLLMTLCMSVHAVTRQEAVKEVRTLHQQSLDLYDKGQYPEATARAQRALELSERELGPQHPQTADCLQSLARLYFAVANYPQAEQLAERALSIREKALGPEHSKTADSLNILANLGYVTGDYAKAESLHRRALAVRQKALGPEHPNTSASLHNLATLYYELGAYAKAEPMFQRALAIAEKSAGPNDPTTAATLDSLGILYNKIGAHAKAESMYQRSLAIRQQALGSEHPATADSLHNLAILYTATGDYVKAESLFQRALAIYEKALGPEHPRMGDDLGSLAILYVETGAYAKAEPLFQRVIGIYEKAAGPEHPSVGEALNNLAALYNRTGAYAKAEPLYQQALAVYEKAFGPEHASISDALCNLAEVYYATNAYAKAEPLYQRALAIREKALGAEHPHTALALGNLADLYSATGAYGKAEPLYQRTLAIFEKALGPQHPSTATALIHLADLYSATAAHAKAEPLYQRAQSIQARNSERFLLTGSESRKRAYLQEMAKSTHKSVSVSLLVRSPASVALGLASVLQYKGRVQDEMSGSVARLRQSVKPADRQIFDRFGQVASQLSTLTYQGLGDLSPAQYRQQLDELRQQQETLEADLARRSVKFRRQFTPVTLEAVRHALPTDAALVEWILYRPSDPGVAGSKMAPGAPRYAAYVLKGNEEPNLVDFGDAQQLDASVREFLESVQDPTRGDLKERTRGLSARLVKPLLTHLDGVERVLLSPDGLLNLVPMAALMDENGQYLVQRFEMTYLTSGRDVLRMAAAATSRAGAIVIADPDYGKPLSALPPDKPLAQVRSAELDRSGVFFRPLPNTATEAQAIKSLLKLGDPSVMLRLDASESNLKRLHGPRILHVASHGFFLTDQELATQLGPQAGLAIDNNENPLLRAGIALAGANARRSGASDDGILTALEAAQLDLQGTELVVLSACESGVGQVQNGEGIYGLRRAFVIAGAQTQVASLWNVLDGATRTLMEDYYQRLLKGQGRSAALREAQQKMLAVQQRSHPYYWASFVPIGNWAPLSAPQ